MTDIREEIVEQQAVWADQIADAMGDDRVIGVTLRALAKRVKELEGYVGKSVLEAIELAEVEAARQENDRCRVIIDKVAEDGRYFGDTMHDSPNSIYRQGAMEALEAIELEDDHAAEV